MVFAVATETFAILKVHPKLHHLHGAFVRIPLALSSFISYQRHWSPCLSPLPDGRPLGWGQCVWSIIHHVGGGIGGEDFPEDVYQALFEMNISPHRQHLLTPLPPHQIEL